MGAFHRFAGEGVTSVAVDVLLVDNFDSFTHNLEGAFVTILRDAMAGRVRTLRPDAVDIEREFADPPTHLVISPGPGHPRTVDVARRLYDEFRGRIPILGVCLGHQLIAHAHGGDVVEGREPVHGKACEIEHDGSSIFAGVPSPFFAARYHSLVVDAAWARDSETVEIRATSDDGVVQALEVVGEPTWGVQFHPESYLTPHGPAILRSFIDVGSAWNRRAAATHG